MMFPHSASIHAGYGSWWLGNAWLLRKVRGYKLVSVRR
jgi:hypothetical protein